MKPITPEQAAQFKLNKIPDFVYEAFNELIQQQFNGTSAYILQDVVMDKVLSKTNDYDRHGIFNNHFLDVESKYREAGWAVSYESDGRNGAYYIFSK